MRVFSGKLKLQLPTLVGAMTGLLIVILVSGYTGSWSRSIFALALGLVFVFAINFANSVMVLYCSLCFFYYGVVPAIQEFTGVNFFIGSYVVPDVSNELWAFMSLHFLGLMTGMLVVQGKNVGVRGCNRRLLGRVNKTALMILQGFVISSVLYIGVDLFLTDRSDHSFLYQSGVIAEDSMSRFFAFVVRLMPAFMVLYLLEARYRYGRSVSPAPLLLSTGLLWVVICNPYNTARFVALGSYFIVFAFYALLKKKEHLILLMAAFIPIVALLILPVTSIMRHGRSALFDINILRSMGSLEFSAFSILIDALNAELGQANYFISHLFIVVPRSVWPAKAESLGGEIAVQAGYVFNNVGVNSFFNAFADFGFLGLFVVSFGFGMLAKKLDPVRQYPSFANRRFMYGLVLMLGIPILVRGDLSTAMIGIYAAAAAYETCRVGFRLPEVRFRSINRSRAMHGIYTQKKDV